MICNEVISIMYMGDFTPKYWQKMSITDYFLARMNTGNNLFHTEYLFASRCFKTFFYKYVYEQ